jgi:hypothetical protein
MALHQARSTRQMSAMVALMVTERETGDYPVIHHIRDERTYTPSANVNTLSLGGAAKTEPRFEAPAPARHSR